jgi:hypothetical protein
VRFNTLLGLLFIHNLLTLHYDWIDTRVYMLTSNAQAFYRQFILHNNLTQMQINMETIKERLHLWDKNKANLITTIEYNILKPLRQHGLILSYEKRINGLKGIKYALDIPEKRTKA